MSLKDLLLLVVILAFAFFSRFFNLAYPGTMYFDEVYHVPSAMMMADGDFVKPFEWWHQSYDGVNNFDWLHPPLAKYFQAISMKFLGKTPIAWRLPSVIFSLLTLVVFYFFLKFIGENFLFKEDKRKTSLFSLLGTLFLSLEGLFLVQSRIAMNDVILLFFILLSVFTYFYYLTLKKETKQADLILLLMGLFWGLALATKWSAFFPLLVLMFYHFFIQELAGKSLLRRLPFLLFVFVLIPFFVYFLAYLPMFLAGKKLSYFWVLQGQILRSQLGNPAVHQYSSTPLQWFFNLRSVLYFSNNKGSMIYALGNPVLFIYFVLTMPLLFISSVLKKNKRILSLLFLLYFASFTFWIFSPRILFFYHYLPAIPFIIVLLSFVITDSLFDIKNLSKRRALLFNIIFWALFVFVLFYPNWTAIAVPENFREAIYFSLETWR